MITLEQLSTHLKKDLSPIYLVNGDESFLVQEARQLIRDSAFKQGFTEVHQHTVTAHFNWQELFLSFTNQSLFSDKQLIELTLPTGKPGDAGAKQLIAYAENPLPDTILLILSGKIDSSTQRSKWVKTLQEKAVVIPIYPILRSHLPSFLTKKLQQAELVCDPAALTLLAERVEGNLTAAAQEIEKLRLLYGPGNLSLEQISTAVTDSGRFDVFKLVDSILLGEKKRIHHILQGLRLEGTDPTLVLWAISREYRLLAQLSYGIHHGKTLKQCAAELNIWNSRLPLLEKIIKNKPTPYFHHLLNKAHEVDCVIKGVKPGDPWLGLLALSVVNF